MSSFSDPKIVSEYAARTAQIVPGLSDMHRMANIIISQSVPVDGRILVLGAGGGLELAAFAGMRPEWRFDGVDPSAEMIAMAKTILGPASTRVNFHEGYIESAPEGPFDAAVCFLTLHFLERAARQRTVNEVFRRLRPGSPFIVAHHSFPNAGAEKDRWLELYAAFSVLSGIPAEQARGGIASMKERLPVLPPAEDEDILRAAGFADINLFYAALTFKGWFCYKPPSP